MVKELATSSCQQFENAEVEAGDFQLTHYGCLGKTKINHLHVALCLSEPLICCFNHSVQLTLKQILPHCAHVVKLQNHKVKWVHIVTLLF